MGKTPTLDENQEPINPGQEINEGEPKTGSEVPEDFGIGIGNQEIVTTLSSNPTGNGDYIQGPSRYDRRESFNGTAMKYREAAEKAKAAGDLKEYARLIDLANEFMAQIPNLDDDGVLERYINKRG